MGKMSDTKKLMKLENPNKVCFIKSGVFYYAIEEDAEYVSPKLGLAIMYLGNNIKKCSFPVNSLLKYERMMKANNIEYAISDVIECKYGNAKAKCKEIRELLKRDLEVVSYEQAEEIACNINEILKRKN